MPEASVHLSKDEPAFSDPFRQLWKQSVGPLCLLCFIFLYQSDRSCRYLKVTKFIAADHRVGVRIGQDVAVGYDTLIL